MKPVSSNFDIVDESSGYNRLLTVQERDSFLIRISEMKENSKIFADLQNEAAKQLAGNALKKRIHLTTSLLD
jgi:hypothetical protein